MHKAVILLTKVSSREEALSNIRTFMEDYGNGNVWSWFAIGGRWNNTLAPKYKEFSSKAEKLLKVKGEKFISQKAIEDKQKELQDIWEKLGMQGKNPYCNHYELSEDGNIYDVIPLSDCIETVKEWHQDPIKSGKQEEAKAKKQWLKKGKEDWNMYGYCLKCAASLYHQDFSFECNVFNTESQDFSIPKDVQNFFAVMVDMHN